MGKLKIVKVAKDSGWYNDRALIEGRVVEYSGITVTASGIHSIDCNFTLEDGQNVTHIRCSEVEEVMSEFKVGDEVEINEAKLSLTLSVSGYEYYAIGKGEYNREYPQNIGVISGEYDGDYLVKGVSSEYWIPASCLELKKTAKLVALKDMSIESFCEATDNRDEVFCKAITYLIEHVVSEDDEQIWIEDLSPFRYRHPRFWQWLIDEGFIGEKEGLKPCPLCGKDVKVYAAKDWFDDSSFGGFNVGCSVLNGGCGCAVGHPKSKEGVIEQWNRRA